MRECTIKWNNNVYIVPKNSSKYFDNDTNFNNQLDLSEKVFTDTNFSEVTIIFLIKFLRNEKFMKIIIDNYDYFLEQVKILDDFLMLESNFIYRIKIFFNLDKFKESINSTFLQKDKHGVTEEFTSESTYQMIYEASDENITKKFDDCLVDWFYNDFIQLKLSKKETDTIFTNIEKAFEVNTFKIKETYN